MLRSDGGHQHWRPSGLQHPGEMGAQMSSGEKSCSYFRKTNWDPARFIEDAELSSFNDSSFQAGIINDDIVKKMPSRGRKRFVSEGDGGLIKDSSFFWWKHPNNQLSGGWWNDGFTVNIIKTILEGYNSYFLTLFVTSPAQFKSQQMICFNFDKFHEISEN